MAALRIMERGGMVGVRAACICGVGRVVGILAVTDRNGWRMAYARTYVACRGATAVQKKRHAARAAQRACALARWWRGWCALLWRSLFAAHFYILPPSLYNAPMHMPLLSSFLHLLIFVVAFIGWTFMFGDFLLYARARTREIISRRALRCSYICCQ